MKLTLLRGQQSEPISASGQFVYIKSCPSVVEVKAQTRKGERIYTLTSREQIQVPSDEAFTSITIINRGGDGEIELETGFGQFVPSLDDLRVKVNLYDDDGNLLSLPVFFNYVPEVSTIQKEGSVFTVEHAQRTVQAVGTGVIELTGATGSIAANPSRKKLVLQASEDNSEDIVIAGFFRVRAGDTQYLEAANAVTVTGLTGDQLYVGEVV